MPGESSSSKKAPVELTPPATRAGWASSTSVPNLKLDKFPKLTNQADYRLWRDSAEYILRTMGCWSIVMEGEEEPVQKEGEESDDYENRVDKYRSRHRWTSVFILETVDFQWLPIITANKTPSRIWKALQDKFARENTVSFHSQFASLLGLRVTSKSDLASTITKFDSEWTRLQTRCSTAKATDQFTLPFVFQTVFESAEAKAAFLLNTLPSSMSNIKDNLMTKDNLTYEQCYQRLMDITTEADDDKAYTAAMTTGGNKGKTATGSSSKECTWCAKHHPKANNKGHSWNECNKLKAFNEKRKKEKDGKEKDEAARAGKETEGSETVGTPTSYPFTSDTAANCYHTSYPPSKATPSTRWIYDTGASSHMTNNLDLFLNIQPYNKRIRYANNTSSLALGIGSIAIQGKLPKRQCVIYSSAQGFVCTRFGV